MTLGRSIAAYGTCLFAEYFTPNDKSVQGSCPSSGSDSEALAGLVDRSLCCVQHDAPHHQCVRGEKDSYFPFCFSPPLGMRHRSTYVSTTVSARSVKPLGTQQAQRGCALSPVPVSQGRIRCFLTFNFIDLSGGGSFDRQRDTKLPVVRDTAHPLWVLCGGWTRARSFQSSQWYH